MSLHEEGYAVAPWVGSNSCKNIFNIVVVGQFVEIIEKIAAVLTEVHARGDQRWKLCVLRSFSLEDVVRQSDLTGRIAFDFVVIGIDARTVYADRAGLAWLKKTIAQVHPDLRARRVIMVNTSPIHEAREEFITLQSDLKIDLMHANLDCQRSSEGFARSVLRYLEVSIGIKTGLPNLNI